MRAFLLAAVSFVLPACFSEATNEGDACPSGTLSCPCAAGQCDAPLVCEASIDRCIQADCQSGFSGCTCSDGGCSDGSECTMGVCTTPSGTSGSVSASNSTTFATAESADPVTTPTTSDSASTMSDSESTMTDSDPVESETMDATVDPDTGPPDTGGEACLAPTCQDCENCASCVACASAQVEGACGNNCMGNKECLARVQCAVLLDDPTAFATECCDLPCEDKICGALFGFWASCTAMACECGGTFTC